VFPGASLSCVSASIELLGKIDGLGATAIPMTPTMFDHHQFTIRKEDPNYRFGKMVRSPQYNALMAFFGAWEREQAMERGCHS
jgi:hypothetical protein